MGCGRGGGGWRKVFFFLFLCVCDGHQHVTVFLALFWFQSNPDKMNFCDNKGVDFARYFMNFRKRFCMYVWFVK